jgi:hypothetical protein
MSIKELVRVQINGMKNAIFLKIDIDKKDIQNYYLLRKPQEILRHSKL